MTDRAARPNDLGQELKDMKADIRKLLRGSVRTRPGSIGPVQLVPDVNDALPVLTPFTNRCTDPSPVDVLNWVGGPGGGTWIAGYEVVLDSTYAGQGLHVRSNSGGSGAVAALAPNGDGFPIDLPDGTTGADRLGSAIKTYRLIEDIEISLSGVCPGKQARFSTYLYVYDAAGTRIPIDGTSDLYQTNQSQVGAIGDITRYSNRILYAPLLADFPTADSVALIVQVGGNPGVDTNIDTWAGECSVYNVGTLPLTEHPPYRDDNAGDWVQNPDGTSSGTIDLSKTVTWAQVTQKPTAFPPSTHQHTAAQILDLVAVIVGYINDSATPSPIRAALDALYSGGSGGGLDEAGIIALVQDGTTPSDLRAALDALYLGGTFSGDGADLTGGPIPTAVMGSGTPAAGTYVDGATGTWTPLPSGGGTGIVETIVAGTNVSVDSTDPANPIVSATGGGSSASVQVDIYTTPQNATLWTKPIGAKQVTIDAVGAGAGGGSGRRGASLSARAGGAGGGAGGGSSESYDGTTLPTSLYVWVGAGGTGGPPRTTDNTNGAAGLGGGDSFVTLSSNTGSITAREDAIVRAKGGAAGGGAGTATVTGGGGGTGTKFNGGQGGSGVVGGSTGQRGIDGGGGGAAGIATNDVVVDNGQGSSRSRGNIATNADVQASNVSGVTAPAGSTSRFASLSPRPGSGGGSSKSADATAAGAGGAGGMGGGGGGGGASLNGFDSGAGGPGGDGYVVITTYL